MIRQLPVLALAACLASLFTGCSKVDSVAHAEKAETPGAALSAARDPLSIDLDDGLAVKVQVGHIEMANVAETISTAGRVDVDQTRVVRIGSPVMGRVLAVNAHEGQHVERGEVLAVVSSTELTEAQLAFLKAITQTQVARRAVERAGVLLKAEVIGAAELQRRQAELEEAEAERQAAYDQLLLLCLSPESLEQVEKQRKIQSTTRILATIRGTILSRKITLGQMIQPADAAFEIADLSSLWLLADVPSNENPGLFVGQPVSALIGPADMRVSGKLAYVSSTVNEETHTVRVHMQLENPRGRFKPAMLATLQLQGRPQAQPCVPLAAVVRENGAEFVFAQTAPRRFQLRPVTLGVEQGARRVVLDGITAGQAIVLDGAFHLNNERRRRALRTGEGE